MNKLFRVTEVEHTLYQYDVWAENRKNAISKCLSDGRISMTSMRSAEDHATMSAQEYTTMGSSGATSNVDKVSSDLGLSGCSITAKSEELPISSIDETFNEYDENGRIVKQTTINRYKTQEKK